MIRPQVVAHRGSSAQHPDNSWPAFEAAAREGADAIECDVQATRDGVIVVRHDLSIDDHLVADLRFAELEARAPGTVVLADLLAFAENTPIDLLVEFKDPDVAEALALMIAANARRDRIVVGSFHGPALAAVKATKPNVQTSFMMGSVAGPEELTRLTAAFRADGVHLCWETRAARPHRLLDRTTIDRLRRAGLAITLWHEEREDELRAMVALEPDAICTNTPAVLRWIVDAHCASSGAGVERGGAARDEPRRQLVGAMPSTRREDN
jgi:glycerophosphoryl diester phosphodiesterase